MTRSVRATEINSEVTPGRRATIASADLPLVPVSWQLETGPTAMNGKPHDDTGAHLPDSHGDEFSGPTGGKGGEMHIARLSIFICLLFCLLSDAVIGCANSQQPTRSLEEKMRARQAVSAGE
jgi:hypothetical protein